jgi:pimeloyl-ACP methyl ester carboxylesterase
MDNKGPSFDRRVARVVAFGGAICAFLLLSLSVWNLAAASWQHKRNSVPGSFYTVDGQQMHMECSGAGSPTVILEAAASAAWSEWRKVEPQLSQQTRVCSYDRAGHGWSEPRKGPRDAESIVRELHSLLDQAGVKPPLVLVGHSAGGLYVREYAREFPSEVVGVALIESSSPRSTNSPDFVTGMTRTSGKRNGNCGRIDYAFGLGGSAWSAIVACPPRTFRVGRLSTMQWRADRIMWILTSANWTISSCPRSKLSG